MLERIVRIGSVLRREILGRRKGGLEWECSCIMKIPPVSRSPLRYSIFCAVESHVPRGLFPSPTPALSRQYSRHFAVVEELACPMGPVRTSTSTGLSAFRSPAWSLSTPLFGGVSSGTVWRPVRLSSGHLSILPSSPQAPSAFPLVQLLYRLPCPLFYPLFSCGRWGVGGLLPSSLDPGAAFG